jgi:hypothetical protein
MSDIQTISQGNYILHNIDAKKLYVQEPLFTANSGDAVYVGWRPDETVLWENDGSVSALSAIMNLNDDVTNYDKLQFYCGIDIDAKNICTIQANTDRATISWREYFQGNGTWRTFSNFFQIGTNSITAGPAICNISNGTNNANWQYSYLAIQKVVGINRKENA